MKEPQEKRGAGLNPREEIGNFFAQKKKAEGKRRVDRRKEVCRKIFSTRGLKDRNSLKKRSSPRKSKRAH